MLLLVQVPHTHHIRRGTHEAESMLTYMSLFCSAYGPTAVITIAIVIPAGLRERRSWGNAAKAYALRTEYAVYI